MAGLPKSGHGIRARAVRHPVAAAPAISRAADSGSGNSRPRSGLVARTTCRNGCCRALAERASACLAICACAPCEACSRMSQARMLLLLTGWRTHGCQCWSSCIHGHARRAGSPHAAAHVTTHATTHIIGHRITRPGPRLTGTYSWFGPPGLRRLCASAAGTPREYAGRC